MRFSRSNQREELPFNEISCDIAYTVEARHFTVMWCESYTSKIISETSGGQLTWIPLNVFDIYKLATECVTRNVSAKGRWREALDFGGQINGRYMTLENYHLLEY